MTNEETNIIPPMLCQVPLSTENNNVALQEMTPSNIGCIVTAYTGRLSVDFHTFHVWVSELLGYPVHTIEFTSEEFMNELSNKSKPFFLEFVKWCNQ